MATAKTSKTSTNKVAKKTPETAKEAEPIVSFASAKAFDAWLQKNHETSGAVFLTLGKAGHPPHITYAEALDVALCWGWIDSQKRKLDDTAWLQRFGPRTKKSPWSKVNVAKADALRNANKMNPAGLREVERAKDDGRWQAAYDSPKTSVVPDDLHAALAGVPAAATLFNKLDSANRFSFLYRIQTAKTEVTRAKRIADSVSMLSRGEVWHPDRLPKKKG